MTQHLEGIYPSIDEAIQKLRQLKEQGYEKHQVTVLANDKVADEFPWNVDGDVESAKLDSEEKNFMDRIKGLFVVTEDDYKNHHSDELLEIREKYRSELENDQIIILLNEEAHKAHESESELDKTRSPLSTAVPHEYERDGYENGNENE